MRASTASRQAMSSGGRWQHFWPQSAGMAERQQIRRSVQLEFAFDRLRASKLEQAYDILVPDRVRIVGGAKMTEASDEDCGDLRSCIVRQAKGREHDRQSNCSADRVCRRAPVRGAARMDLRRRRL